MAELRFSDAPLWGPCPGSVPLQKLFPRDGESEKRRAGVAAHYWVTEALMGNTLPVGTLAPNGHPIDAEMIDAGQLLLTDVWSRWGAASATATFRVEQDLTAHGLIHPEAEGRVDAFLCDAAAHRIIAWEYKYGHREVEAFRNMQGLAEIAGVLEAFELTREDVKGWEVLFVIVQPRSFRSEKVRVWRMLGWQAWEDIGKLALRAEEALGPHPQAFSGAHCRDCSAAWQCMASLQMGAATMDFATEAQAANLTDLGLGQYLRNLHIAAKRIEALKTSMEEVALSKIKTGGSVPYWGIGHGDAREKWTQPIPDVIAMGKMMGVELAKPVAVLTPNQAREAGLDPAVVQQYSDRPQGAAKLIPVDEKAAAKAFS